MTEARHHRRSLGEWTLDSAGFRKLDRRSMVGAALAVGAAATVFGSKPASALTLEKMPAALVGAIPPRKGVVPWDSLSKVEVRPGQAPKFPEAVAKLDGHSAVIEGHMMVLDDDDPLDRFLLTAYQAHCLFCMPGGFTSIVAIHAAHPVKVMDKPLTMRGNLRLLTDNKESRLLYRLDNATPITSA
jgi:hypothetical protein